MNISTKLVTHTPGPWKTTDGIECIEIITEDEQWSLALVLSDGDVDGEVEANARLISAAPEMLEMLESLVWDLDQRGLPSKEELNAVKQVIRKARG